MLYGIEGKRSDCLERNFEFLISHARDTVGQGGPWGKVIWNSCHISLLDKRTHCSVGPWYLLSYLWKSQALKILLCFCKSMHTLHEKTLFLRAFCEDWLFLPSCPALFHSKLGLWSQTDLDWDISFATDNCITAWTRTCYSTFPRLVLNVHDDGIDSIDLTGSLWTPNEILYIQLLTDSINTYSVFRRSSFNTYSLRGQYVSVTYFRRKLNFAL